MPRWFLHAALAVWVFIVSTCCETAHAHCGGATPHSHHVGFSALPEPAPPTDEPQTRHWHLMLLWIEAGTLASDPCGDDGDDESGVTVGLGCTHSAATANSPDTAMPEAPVVVAIIEPTASPALPTLADSTVITDTSRSRCAKAARARTGVQLA